MTTPSPFSYRSRGMMTSPRSGTPKLDNAMVTDVRQRVLREHLCRRGIKVDPGWAYLRLLLRNGEALILASRLRPK